MIMSQPTTFSEVIPYLNHFIQKETPGQLVEAMIELFKSHPYFAAALIPTYAKYLNPQDFDRLTQSFPGLSPLLNGYRQVLGLKVA